MTRQVPDLPDVMRTYLHALSPSRHEPTAAERKRWHDEDPKHQKALARRKKRKRGGPK